MTGKRTLTFEQWSTINRALCGARLELRGCRNLRSKQERLNALNDAVDVINDFKEVL